MFWIILFFIISKPITHFIRKKYFGYVSDDDKLDVHEGLDNYWNSLKDYDRQEWIDDEKHLRTRFGIKVLEDDQYESLKNSKEGHKLILGTPNYEILNNPSYMARFQYVPIDQRDTEQEHEQSDKVLSIIYLAYMNKEKQQ